MNTISEIYVRLDAIPWFSQCGIALPGKLPFRCAAVRDWSEATALCGGHVWDCVTNEARNAITLYLHRFFRDEYQKWNPLVRDAKEALASGAWAKLETYADEHNLESFVAGRVRWDTLNAVMEAAYQDFNPPVFFLKLLEVYESGHFPCGWEGDFPNGTLLVL